MHIAYRSLDSCKAAMQRLLYKCRDEKAFVGRYSITHDILLKQSTSFIFSGSFAVYPIYDYVSNPIPHQFKISFKEYNCYFDFHTQKYYIYREIPMVQDNCITIDRTLVAVYKKYQRFISAIIKIAAECDKLESEKTETPIERISRSRAYRRISF